MMDLHLGLILAGTVLSVMLTAMTFLNWANPTLLHVNLWTDEYMLLKEMPNNCPNWLTVIQRFLHFFAQNYAHFAYMSCVSVCMIKHKFACTWLICLRILYSILVKKRWQQNRHDTVNIWLSDNEEKSIQSNFLLLSVFVHPHKTTCFFTYFAFLIR